MRTPAALPFVLALLQGCAGAPKPSPTPPVTSTPERTARGPVPVETQSAEEALCRNGGRYGNVMVRGTMKANGQYVGIRVLKTPSVAAGERVQASLSRVHFEPAQKDEEMLYLVRACMEEPGHDTESGARK